MWMRIMGCSLLSTQMATSQDAYAQTTAAVPKLINVKITAAVHMLLCVVTQCHCNSSTTCNLQVTSRD
jgi:hypothetical protein